MLVLKRIFLTCLIISTFVFMCYQLYLVIAPVMQVSTEAKYAQLIDKAQILKMQRLVLEEQYALAKTREKVSKLVKSQQSSNIALNQAYLQPRSFLFPKHMSLVGWQFNRATTENVALSLREAKTFEQLEAYVSTNKPSPPPPVTKDERQLLQYSANDFTLQLMGVRESAELKKFISENNLQDARVFHTYYLNKDWYVLVYGKYPDHTEALKAIETLPAHIKELKPWIRQLSSVQRAIQLFR